MADTFGGFAAVCLDEAHVREREGHHQEVQDLPDPGNDGLGLAEVDLRGAGRPHQFGETFPCSPVAGRPFLHEPLHRRIGAGEPVFIHEPVEHAFGRMPLPAIPALVPGEPRFDNVLEPGQHRDPGPGQRRRRCRGEVFLIGVFRHRGPANAQGEGDLPARDSLGVQPSDIFLYGHGYRHLLSSPSGAYASQWQRRKEPIWGWRAHVPDTLGGPSPPGDLYLQASPRNHDFQEKRLA
ncbi:hypothetical protein J2X01_003878 [Arthrobacter ginsengisoli]|uniref:Uncharacterized protein n=1 Tax=Arthrobacter ginsengisoli TaxID=1356565 RepID=A0ABU1UH92_9MICC|nr:hypothetical protein [Arthrobacter ginsengisoli]